MHEKQQRVRVRKSKEKLLSELLLRLDLIL